MKDTIKIEFREIKIGKHIFVSDPCYPKNNGGNIQLNAKNGIYKTFAEKCKMPFWGERVASISIVHIDYIDNIDSLRKEYIGDICVDSGTAGIYDGNYFEKYHFSDTIDDDWYDKYICTKLDNIAIFDGKSIVSSAGIGDGVYGVYGVYDENNQIVALTIQYIDNDHFDDEDD